MVGVLAGDVERDAAARIKYGLLFAELGKRFPGLGVFDADLKGASRLLVALLSFRPDRRSWRELFHKNPVAFRGRSRRAAAHLAALDGDRNVVLQVGALLDARRRAPSPPSVIYTDYTARLSARHPEAGRSPLGPRRRERWFRLEETAYRRATHVCTRSDFVRANLIDEYGLAPERISVVGGGVNFDPLPATGRRAGGNGAGPTALFIGKELHRKGGDLLLRAFAETRGSVPDARLLIVTGDPIPSDLPLAGVTVMPPVWERDRLSALYRQADLFVLPSRLETWGDVLLEAMAHGLPCLGVAGEAMDEIIVRERTGRLVPPADPAALAAALIELLPAAERLRSWGSAGRERVEAEFTWAKVADRLAPILESAVDSR